MVAAVCVVSLRVLVLFGLLFAACAFGGWVGGWQFVFGLCGLLVVIVRSVGFTFLWCCVVYVLVVVPFLGGVCMLGGGLDFLVRLFDLLVFVCFVILEASCRSGLRLGGVWVADCLRF